MVISLADFKIDAYLRIIIHKIVENNSQVEKRFRDSGGQGSALPPAKQAAGQIETKTYERRILQRRTFSIERPTSNVEYG